MAFAFLANGAQYFFEEKGKPQRGRKAAAPLHTPRAFFKEFLVVDKGRVLTCVCMRRCWERKSEPMEENGLKGLLRVKKS